MVLIVIANMWHHTQINNVLIQPTKVCSPTQKLDITNLGKTAGVFNQMSMIQHLVAH